MAHSYFYIYSKYYDKPRQRIKKQRYHFAKKGLYTQSYGFSSSHVWIWSWTMKTAEHWRSDAFELWCWKRLLRVPWTARRSNQSILKEPWTFIGRTDAEAIILWPPDAKSWLIGKDPDAGEDGRQKENGAVEDEMVGQHHWHDGHEFEQTLGVDDGKEVWRAAVHGVTKSWTQLSVWTELNWILVHRAHLSMGFSRQ